MAPEKSPAFQFYPKEFLTDGHVAGMSAQEVGVYIRLLCVCWQEQSLPIENARLAQMAGVPLSAFKRLWPAVQVCFVEHDGRYIHLRLEKEREKQEAYRRRQSDKGKARAQQRASLHAAGTQPEPSHGSTGQPATAQPIPSSPISDLRTSVVSLKEPERHTRASLSDPFVNPTTTERAGRFIERYEALYGQHRHGAKYARKEHRDYAAAVTLCQTWPDDAHLDELAAVFLTTDHKFAEEGSRTIPQFLALASWCDSRLLEWKAKQRARA